MGKAGLVLTTLLTGIVLGLVTTASSQEVVLTNGSRLRGTVEKYENGFAYIRLIKESGKSLLSILPEAAIDKNATENAQSRAVPRVETRETREGPFKLPHNDLELERPDIVAVAKEEKERRDVARDTGVASRRVFRNGNRMTGIPTPIEILELSDLRLQPTPESWLNEEMRGEGPDFYEVRLEILAQAFLDLGVEWEDMWLHCSPTTYAFGPSGAPVSEAQLRELRAGLSRADYRDAVLTSYRSSRDRMDNDRWPASCVRRHSDYLARGRQVIDAYHNVYQAYAQFAGATGQRAAMAPRSLPLPQN